MVGYCFGICGLLVGHFVVVIVGVEFLACVLSNLGSCGLGLACCIEIVLHWSSSLHNGT